MSESTQHPHSPHPVPRAFHHPHPLESTHHLYNHQPRDHGERVVKQDRWNSSGNNLHHQYRQHQSTYTRTEQTHHHTVTSHMSPQLHQHAHQYHQSRHDSIADSRSSRGGLERWVYLGRHYHRDNPDSEWVESWKPPVHLVTDIYGIPEGDPLYRPHLRYTPREFDDGDAPQEQAEMQPMASQAPSHAMGGSEMPPSRSMNRGFATGTQPIDNSSSSHTRPRSRSPLPMPYRPWKMPGILGTADDEYPGSSQPLHQDRLYDTRFAAQPSDGRGSSRNSRPVGPDITPQHQVPAASHAPNETLETREDPWEFFFGSKGYVTLAPGDERPAWWKD